MQNPPSKIIHIESNQQIDKLDRISYFSLTKLTLHGAMWPKFIVSFIGYYKNDLEANAFALPFVMW